MIKLQTSEAEDLALQICKVMRESLISVLSRIPDQKTRSPTLRSSSGGRPPWAEEGRHRELAHWRYDKDTSKR
jgi:hypothetical protein